MSSRVFAKESRDTETLEGIIDNNFGDGTFQLLLRTNTLQGFLRTFMSIVTSHPLYPTSPVDIHNPELLNGCVEKVLSQKWDRNHPFIKPYMDPSTVTTDEFLRLLQNPTWFFMALNTVTHSPNPIPSPIAYNAMHTVIHTYRPEWRKPSDEARRREEILSDAVESGMAYPLSSDEEKALEKVTRQLVAMAGLKDRTIGVLDVGTGPLEYSTDVKQRRINKTATYIQGLLDEGVTIDAVVLSEGNHRSILKCGKVLSHIFPTISIEPIQTNFYTRHTDVDNFRLAWQRLGYPTIASLFGHFIGNDNPMLVLQSLLGRADYAIFGFHLPKADITPENQDTIEQDLLDTYWNDPKNPEKNPSFIMAKKGGIFGYGIEPGDEEFLSVTPSARYNVKLVTSINNRGEPASITRLPLFQVRFTPQRALSLYSSNGTEIFTIDDRDTIVGFNSWRIPVEEMKKLIASVPGIEYLYHEVVGSSCVMAVKIGNVIPGVKYKPNGTTSNEAGSHAGK